MRPHFPPSSNISKVKYFLHGRRSSLRQSESVHNKSHHRKSSTLIDENTPIHTRHPHTSATEIKEHTFNQHDLQQYKRVQTISEGLLENSTNKDMYKLQREGIYNMLDDEGERAEFFQFLETLKNDSAYQNTITMFTVMYYYERKRKDIEAGNRAELY